MGRGVSGENITRSGKGKWEKEEEAGTKGGSDELEGDVMEEKEGVGGCVRKRKGKRKH